MNFKLPVIAPTFLILLSSFLLPILNTANADPPVAMITAGTGPVARAFDSPNGDGNITNSNSNESSGNTASVMASSSLQSAPPSPLQQPPIRTRITSVTDGNEDSIQNGSTTFSTSIGLQVRSTQGSNPISGFECGLDNKPFSMCANTNLTTINFNNLTAGQQHTLTVRAIDNVANTDPNPARFRWTIISPQQAIQRFVSIIDNMHLTKSASISLDTPLIFTIRLLNREDTAACNTFNAFINNVNANQATGQLTAQQAATLRQHAAPIQHAMGCAVSPLSSSLINDNNNSTAVNMTNPAPTINTKSQTTTTPPQQQQSEQQQQPLTANVLNSHNNNSDNRSPSIVSILPF
jgi:hypothetical protein